MFESLGRFLTWIRRRDDGGDQPIVGAGGERSEPSPDASCTLPSDFVESPEKEVAAAALPYTARRRRLERLARTARLGIDGRPADWGALDWGRDADITVYLPGRLLVRPDRLDAVREAVGPDARACELRGGLVLLRWDEPGPDPLEVANRFDEDPPAVAPDHLVLLAPGYVFGPGTDPVPAATPPDEGYRPSERIGVTVLDTGLYDQSNPPPGGVAGTPVPTWLTATGPVPPEHRDLLDLNGDNYLDDAAGHGTFIADIVASMAPCADLTVERVGPPDGLIAESDLLEALERWLARITPERPELLNLSLGVYPGSREPLGLGRQMERLHDVVKERDLDVLVVAAAGNDHVSRPFYPAAFAPRSELVVSVGALDDDDPTAPADYSNYGKWVAVWAPGTARAFYPPGVFRYGNGATQAWFKDSAAIWAGTSFATPYVVGALASAYCEDRAAGPLAKTRAAVLQGEPMPEKVGGGLRLTGRRAAATP